MNKLVIIALSFNLICITLLTLFSDYSSVDLFICTCLYIIVVNVLTND